MDISLRNAPNSSAKGNSAVFASLITTTNNSIPSKRNETGSVTFVSESATALDASDKTLSHSSKLT